MRLTLSVTEAAKIIGISMALAYELVARGASVCPTRAASRRPQGWRCLRCSECWSVCLYRFIVVSILPLWDLDTHNGWTEV